MKHFASITLLLIITASILTGIFIPLTNNTSDVNDSLVITYSDIADSNINEPGTNITLESNETYYNGVDSFYEDNVSDENTSDENTTEAFDAEIELEVIAPTVAILVEELVIIDESDGTIYYIRGLWKEVDINATIHTGIEDTLEALRLAGDVNTVEAVAIKYE